MTTEQEVKHTPGPWTIEQSTYGDLTIQSDADPETQGMHGGRKIARIPAALGDDIQAANARLIAAAPDMAAELTRLRESNHELLEACKDALQSLQRLPDVDGAYRVTCIAQLKAAVEKAETTR